MTIYVFAVHRIAWSVFVFYERIFYERFFYEMIFVPLFAFSLSNEIISGIIVIQEYNLVLACGIVLVFCHLATSKHMDGQAI